MLTDELGDYMRFTFKGTAISIIGTIGVRQGLIEFLLDGGDERLDRGWPKLVCDEVIFEATDLPYGEHQLFASLTEKGINPNTGEKDGVFSVQWIM
ncbi:hypothetical protein FRC00_006754 [Tulasnella sp. 408]|nr:hypothetical protein FRC00_006754 [Tulasnella sp. 408]